MNARLFRSTFWVLGFCLALGFTAVSCKDDDDKDAAPTNELRYQNLSLTGAKEVPANQSANTGAINATYNKDTNMITYTLSWTGFTATNMHFHKVVDPAQPGPVSLPIPKSSATATAYTSPVTGTLSLTDAQETELLSGIWYVNIHSAAFPGGEIRVMMVPN